MLKTYRFIPIVFILWLFGFTLITVSPVFAEDSPEFIACQQMKWKKGKKAKKNCFRDVARLFQDQLSASKQLVADTEPTDYADGLARLEALLVWLKDNEGFNESGITWTTKCEALGMRKGTGSNKPSHAGER